jgi:hypothetical protein
MSTVIVSILSSNGVYQDVISFIQRSVTSHLPTWAQGPSNSEVTTLPGSLARQKHTHDPFLCTVLTLRKVLPQRCYNEGMCVSNLKQACIFPPLSIALAA